MLHPALVSKAGLGGRFFKLITFFPSDLTFLLIIDQKLATNMKFNEAFVLLHVPKKDLLEVQCTFDSPFQ